MKRGFPQKVKPVAHDSVDAELVAGQSKQTPLGANRKARTSAAMIGLALSMGASSLLLPRQDDGAAAAEPLTNDVTLVPASQGMEALAPFPGADVEPSRLPSLESRKVRHVVQDGQTLWQLSRKYQVSVSEIAVASAIVPGDILREGQTLTIPLAEAATGSSRGQQRSFEAVDGPVAPTALTDEAKAARDASLSRLRQQRDKLKDSLAESRSYPTDSTISEAANPTSAIGLAPSDAIAVSPASQMETQVLENATVHEVQPGETLGTIALAYGVSQESLQTVNQLSDPDWLRANQSLLVPSGEQMGDEGERSASAPQPAGSLPQSAATFQPTLPHAEYRVAAGDTVRAIARVHRVPEEVLVSVNQLSDPNFIRVGQVLTIPGKDMQAEAATSAPATVAFADQLGASEVESAQLQASAVIVPTVPTTETILPSASPTPVVPQGGESATQELTAVPPTSQEVAVAPLSVPPTAGDEGDELNPFVRRLLVDVMELRDRYRSSEVPATSSSAVVAAAAAGRYLPAMTTPNETVINPQFVPEPAEAVETSEAEAAAVTAPSVPAVEIEAVSPAANVEVAPEPVVERSPVRQPQLVAAAPLGSESYEPLVRPITGTIVSPELPPLPGAEQFLPNGSSRFSGYIWPSRGVLTSGYGWRWGRMHRGIDIAAPVGTPVHAAAGGVVEFSGWNSGGYGNMVEIRHADGSMTRYAHHSRNLVRAGQRVEQGQQIAQIGSTGFSTGPHLHFEVHLPNQGTVNPIAYLAAR